jgi:hypothetical protein
LCDCLRRIRSKSYGRAESSHHFQPGYDYRYHSLEPSYDYLQPGDHHQHNDFCRA